VSRIFTDVFNAAARVRLNGLGHLSRRHSDLRSSRRRPPMVADGGAYMDVLTRVRELFGEDAVYECRHCGTTLGADVTECPTCGAGEVVRYEIT